MAAFAEQDIVQRIPGAQAIWKGDLASSLIGVMMGVTSPLSHAGKRPGLSEPQRPDAISSAAVPKGKGPSPVSAIQPPTHVGGSPMPSPTRTPSLMQKILFAVRTVDQFLKANPSSKVLMVVANKKVKQYIHYLQSQCQSGVTVHHFVDGSAEGPNESQWEETIAANQVIVASSNAIGDVRQEGAVVQLTAFGLLLLDYDFSRDVYHYQPTFVYLYEKWASLPEGGRPQYVDLFSLGEEVSVVSSTPLTTPLLPSSPPPSPSVTKPPLEQNSNDRGPKVTLTKPLVLAQRPAVLQRSPQPHVSELTLYSSCQIFMAYCSAMLGSEVSEAQLFLIQKGIPQDRLLAVQYPTLQGPMWVTWPEAEKAWGGRTYTEVVDRERFPGLKDIDRQKIYLLYPIILDLKRQGLLDLVKPVKQATQPIASSNPRPAASPFVGLTDKLPLPTHAPQNINLRVPQGPMPVKKIASNVMPMRPADNSPMPSWMLQEAASGSAVCGFSPAPPSKVKEPADIQRRHPSIPGVKSSTTTYQKPIRSEKSDTSKTAKVQLNELMQLVARNPGSSPVHYSTHMGPDGWEALVEICGNVGGRCVVTGDPRATKKESEESAAERALQMLLSQQ